MPVEVKDRRDGQTYNGQSADSVARRIWGRTVWVKRGSQLGEGVWEGMVCRRDKHDHNSHHVLAHIIVHEN